MSNFSAKEELLVAKIPHFEITLQPLLKFFVFRQHYDL